MNGICLPALFLDPSNPILITIVGPMGCGKTTELIRRIVMLKRKTIVFCIGHAKDIERQKLRRVASNEEISSGIIETYGGQKESATLVNGRLMDEIAKTESQSFINANIIAIDKDNSFQIW